MEKSFIQGQLLILQVLVFIQFRITNNKVIYLEQIIGIFLLTIPFLNLWVFFGYYAKLYIVGFTLIVLLILKLGARSSWNKAPLIISVFLAYMTIQMLLINFPASFTYYIIIITGCLITQLNLTKRTIDTMLSFMVAIGLFYAVTMIWQWASLDTFNSVLRLFVLEGNYQQAIESVKYAGDFTGFACESNRAYCLAINALRTVVSNIGNSYQSSLGKYIAQGNKDATKSHFISFCNGIWTISTIFYCTCLILINPFIKLYVGNIGDANYYQPLFAAVIILANYIYCIREPYRLLILSAGKFKETNNGAIIEALLNISRRSFRRQS